MIYLIEHPKAAFNGVVGGIDFVNGIGSTSSREDAKRIAERIRGRFDAADTFKASRAPVAPPSAPEASGPTIPADTAPAAEKPKRAGGRKPK